MNKKNSLIYSLGIFFVTIFLFGCTKAPINGNLDGQWEVIEVFPEPSEKVIQERLFYNFSLHVCLLSYYGGYFMTGNMLYNENQDLYISIPFGLTDKQTLGLAQYGILSNPVYFKVEFPNKHTLILSNEESYVKLKKF